MNPVEPVISIAEFGGIEEFHLSLVRLSNGNLYILRYYDKTGDNST